MGNPSTTLAEIEATLIDLKGFDRVKADAPTVDIGTGASTAVTVGRALTNTVQICECKGHVALTFPHPYLLLDLLFDFLLSSYSVPPHCPPCLLSSDHLVFFSSFPFVCFSLFAI